VGTRADFYVGRGHDAEWIGSIGYDGWPDGAPRPTLTKATEEWFRFSVAIIADVRPEDGWPWTWKDSGTTDYAYAFEGGRVYCSASGGPWQDALKWDDDADDTAGMAKVAVFPDMIGKV